MAKDMVISYIYLVISLGYLMIGLYTFFLNKKNLINRLFFQLSIMLSIWSWAYALATISETRYLALIFNKQSVFGWVYAYPMFYIIARHLTYPNKHFSKRRYFLIFLPSLFFIAKFVVFGTHSDFNLVMSAWGWTAITPKDISNSLFDVYSIILGILAILHLIRWSNQMLRDRSSRYGRVFIVLLVTTFICIFVFNFVFIRLLSSVVIQSTVIWVFLPYLTSFYSLRKNKLIVPIKINIVDENIDENSRASIFRLLGYFYCICAYWLVAVNFIWLKEQTFLIVGLAFTVCILGVLHFYLDVLIKRDKWQYTFIMVIALAVISATYYISDTSFAVSTWGIYFCYLIMTTVFNEARHNYILTGFFVAIQLYWSFMETTNKVEFDCWDFYGRIIIAVLCSYLVLRINRAYRKRIRDNIIHIELQKTINCISEIMIDITIDNLPIKVKELITLCNDDFNCVSTTYCIFDNGCPNTYRILNHQIKVTTSLDNTILSSCDNWRTKLEKGQNIAVLDINHSDMDQKCQLKLSERGIDGFYIFPVLINGVLRSVLIFEFQSNPKNQLLLYYGVTLKNLLSKTLSNLDDQKALYTKANFDDITGRLNRSYFRKNVQRIFDETINEHYLLYIDINNFKTINDTFGPSVGDNVLKQFSDVLVEQGHSDNLVARYNGDEFTVFCSATYTYDSIQKYASQLIKLFKKGFGLEENKFRFNISIGIAKFPQDGIVIDALVKNADIARNKAKARGFSSYHFYDALDKEQAEQIIIYRDRLFSALAKNEFKLAYQPQVACTTGKVIGAEALLRWDSPEFGLIPPYKFIPILENTGLIVEVGEWVIEETMREYTKLMKNGFVPIRFSINLSVVQFVDTSLVDKIRRLKDKYQINTGDFEFEITESVAINDDNFVQETFNKIKDMGFSIAIDDFGTAFSSLNRLQTLPLDRLKVDKSFVDGIAVDEKKEAILEIIIDLSKKLGLASIAEGVEENYQLEYLKKLNCDEIQGYYFAKPMFNKDFEIFVSQNS